VIVTRRLSGVPAVGVVAASLGITALIYAPPGLVQMPHHVPSAAVWSSVVGLAVICTALAFVVFFALIAEVGPVRATVITYINPAVALFLGVALLHERLTGGVILGFAMILVGSVVANRRDPRPSQPAEELAAQATLA
jgi:drug/metabolite transporter (DMT)-like permease